VPCELDPMSSMECIAQNEFLGHLGRTMPYLLMVFMASVCVSCLVVGVRGLPEVCEEPPNARTGTMNCTGSVTKWNYFSQQFLCKPSSHPQPNKGEKEKNKPFSSNELVLPFLD
ncbi:hypothetical protein MTO96_043674, partial [Rhipicephalus appendiculatus]